MACTAEQRATSAIAVAQSTRCSCQNIICHRHGPAVLPLTIAATPPPPPDTEGEQRPWRNECSKDINTRFLHASPARCRRAHHYTRAMMEEMDGLTATTTMTMTLAVATAKAEAKSQRSRTPKQH